MVQWKLKLKYWEYKKNQVKVKNKKIQIPIKLKG